MVKCGTLLNNPLGRGNFHNLITYQIHSVRSFSIYSFHAVCAACVGRNWLTAGCYSRLSSKPDSRLSRVHLLHHRSGSGQAKNWIFIHSATQLFRKLSISRQISVNRRTQQTKGHAHDIVIEKYNKKKNNNNEFTKGSPLSNDNIYFCISHSYKSLAVHCIVTDLSIFNHEEEKKGEEKYYRSIYKVCLPSLSDLEIAG